MSTKITEDTLKSLSSPESFDRGYNLFLSGAVFDTLRQGDLLTGKCEGTGAPFYQLRVRVGEGGIQGADCTCPYEWGGYCKHIVALMLTYIHDPDAFPEQQALEDLLEGLEKDDLVRLIVKMIDRHPDLYAWLKTAVATASIKSDPSPANGKRKTQVSKTEYRREIQSILHSLRGYRMSEAYWMMGGMVDQLNAVRDSAYEFLAAGDAEGALVILTTLLVEVSGSYAEFDDSDGELGGFLADLTLPMMEAILSAGLSQSEKRRLSEDLEPVIAELADYGIEGLDGILAALEQSWSPEPPADLEDADLEDEGYDDTLLVEARLNVLERQNQVEEFLQLCLEYGEHRRYILKQIEVGAYEKAVETASKTLTQAEDAWMVARALRDAGLLQEGLQLAEKGLGLYGSKHGLGAWLGPIEESQGRIQQAIQAYQAAFTSQPSLDLYAALKRLSGREPGGDSGGDWRKLKPALMQVLQASPSTDVLVDVYLFEEEWDWAIDVAGREGDWNYPLIEKVADAVLPFRPDWVIQASRKQAEGMIVRTQSKYYPAAARWLAKMKQAYLSAGRNAEWLAYLDGLKQTYARRPALQAELRKL